MRFAQRHLEQVACAFSTVRLCILAAAKWEQRWTNPPDRPGSQATGEPTAKPLKKFDLQSAYAAKEKDLQHWFRHGGNGSV